MKKDPEPSVRGPSLFRMKNIRGDGGVWCQDIVPSCAQTSFLCCVTTPFRTCVVKRPGFRSESHEGESEYAQEVQSRGA